MNNLLVALIIMAALSFVEKKELYFHVDDVKKNYVKIKPGLYVSKYEASNADYRNFLSDLAMAGQSNIYNACLPDTACWKDKSHAAEPLTRYYFRDPAYNDYPVVGISYEAANQYCDWLTGKYNQNPKRKFNKVVFSLLSRDEWMYAACKGDTLKVYTWGRGFMQNNRKQDLCNYRHTIFVFDSLAKRYNEFPDVVFDTTRKYFTVAAMAYFPSSSGLYNMCGNVAEMVMENGIAAGGGFDDPAYMVRIASKKTYNKPQADIGFRVAMRIVEN